jgi:type II secretory pathway pseudopilin PulG
MRKAFSMIELIFIIVVLGILTAVALPKLAATRDDARAANELNKISTRITSIMNIYNSKGDFELAMSETSHYRLECCTFENSSEIDGTIHVNVNMKSGDLPSYCPAVERGGLKQKIIGEHVLTVKGSLIN